MPKLTEADDVEHYLTTIERVATAYKWPKEVWMMKLLPLMLGKAKAAYASMGMEECSNFEKVRKAVFRQYDICKEPYRQRFHRLKIATWSWRYGCKISSLGGRNCMERAPRRG